MRDRLHHLEFPLTASFNFATYRDQYRNRHGKWGSERGTIVIGSRLRMRGAARLGVRQHLGYREQP